MGCLKNSTKKWKRLLESEGNDMTRENRLDKVIMPSILIVLYALIAFLGYKLYGSYKELEYTKLYIEHKEASNASIEAMAQGKVIYRNMVRSTHSLDEYATYGTTGTATIFDDDIYIFTGVTDAEADYAKQFINLIPERIAQKLHKDGYRFWFYNHEIGSEVENTFLVGQVDYDEKLICIDCGKSALDNGVILHEVGHVVFEKYGLKEKLYKAGIYNTSFSEMASYYDPFAETNSVYIYQNIEEMCANLFADYCIYPDLFISQAPEIYGYYKAVCE